MRILRFVLVISIFTVFGSISIEATPRLATPNLTSAIQKTNSSIELKWDANNLSVEQFYIYRSYRSGSLGSRISIRPGNETSFTDNSPFKIGTTYYYRVKAVKKGYTTSLASNFQSVRIVNIVPVVITPAPTPVPVVIETSSYVYKRNVVSFIFNPVNTAGEVIDPNAHTDVISALRNAAQSQSKTIYQLIEDWISRQNTMALGAIKEASKFRGYKNANAMPSVVLENIQTFRPGTPIPYVNDVLPDSTQYLIDMNAILSDKNICDLVDNQGVREVWIYKTRSRDGYFHPEFYISSPNFNHALEMGWKRSAAPVCAKTYTIVVHDTERWDLFMHVWYHSLEALMRKIDNATWSLWQGPCDSTYTCYPLPAGGTQTKTSRCGNAHNAPNARSEYDITNPAPALSDCEDYNPDGVNGFGTIAEVSCSKWGCSGAGTIESNETRNYTIWNLQNMPGLNNTITHGGKPYRNWWEAYIEFDNLRATGAKFTK